jgi:hypothetical protein
MKTMKILSHRGYWKNDSEKNQEKSFHRSFELGFGTETDLRDLGGKIVISHDMPVDVEFTADNFFRLYTEYQSNLPLALNIKSDGLQRSVKILLEKYSINNFFVFDMSVPDARSWINYGIRIFTRESEFEPTPYFYEQAAGVWLDSFLSDWVKEETITNHLHRGKQVCLVSPELHNREYKTFWKYIRGTKVIHHPNLMLCTDYPEEARNFFTCYLN